MAYDKAQFNQQPLDIDFENDDFDDDFNDDFEPVEDDPTAEDDDTEIARILAQVLSKPSCNAKK